MLASTLLLALLSAQSVAPAQQGSVLEKAAPEARATWQRLVAASGSATREPITAFHLQAEVRTRAGVSRNEAEVDYRYLAPDCMRFMLPSQNETGRFGAAPENYWLKSKDGVVVLAGRQFQEDRRQVDDMVALSKNYVALSNPGRIQLVALELLAAPPADLGALARTYPIAKTPPDPLPQDVATTGAQGVSSGTSQTKGFTWLALESPDFALVRRELASGPANPAASYRVELALAPDFLPAVAIIREKKPGGGDPLLVELSHYEERDGFKIPLQLLVHVLDRELEPDAFARDASQEIFVKTAELRPKLTPEDFKPRK